MTREPYDVLVVATGISTGLGRAPTLQDAAAVDAELAAAHSRVASSSTVAVVGGGPTALESAAQIADAFPHIRVDLYFPGCRALAHHHPRVWDRTRRELHALRVGLHPGHRADSAPELGTGLGAGPVIFGTGQPPAHVDLVVWTVGRARPNTGWLPASLLDEDGYVRVDRNLRVHGHHEVWAVGDIAATDPLRGSARNRGAALLAHNVVASLRGRRLRAYRPREHRQGTVLHEVNDGMTIFSTRGHSLRVRSSFRYAVLERWAVRRAEYGGVRDELGATSGTDKA